MSRHRRIAAALYLAVTEILAAVADGTYYVDDRHPNEGPAYSPPVHQDPAYWE